MVILCWFLASSISAILYRLGGMIQTKIRDFGVPTIATLYLITIASKMSWQHSWCIWIAFLLHFGMLFGALTTYWKKKGEDARWWNWLLTGLGYSLVALPIALSTGHWIGFAIRCIVLTGFITIWSEFVGNDIFEEGGRGFSIVATLPLLLI